MCDLLASVLRVGPEYWAAHADDDQSVTVVVADLKPVSDAVRNFLDREL